MKPELNTSTVDIIKWFQLEFPDLVHGMKDSSHHYDFENLNPFHYEDDVWSHTMMVCLQARNIAPKNDIVRWSTILHDIGKPSTRETVDETKRVRYFNHVGLSAFMLIDILNKTNISISDKIMIHKVVGLHDDLFRFMNKDGQINKKLIQIYKGEKGLFQNLIYQTNADNSGRFCTDNNGLDNSLINKFSMFISQLEDFNFIKDTTLPDLTVLIGPPASGKSTYIDNNLDKENSVIISRDNLVVAVGEKRGLNYNETFNFLIKNVEVEKTEVTDIINENIVNARKNGKNVIIDQTNMSKKVRRRWFNEFRRYNTKAVVFLVGLNELRRRNDERSKQTGKFIPEYVLMNMIKRYSVPMFSEGFDEIVYHWI